jgi:hypothetical protein
VTAFYLPRGEGRFEPTRSTESPWDPAMQHGGPPAALLAHLMAPGGDLRLARITVDFLGPIPRRECVVEVSPIKPGKLTALVEARMLIDGRAAVVARGWHIAAGPTPPVVTLGDAPPLIGEQPQEIGDWGYGRAIEWRFAEGGVGRHSGFAAVWTRVRFPLIEGEEMTGTARTLIVADSANGLSAALPMDEWLSIPPAMTTTLMRPADGEWVHVTARTDLTADGLGLTHGDLHDEKGRLGVVTQPLLVRSRAR